MYSCNYCCVKLRVMRTGYNVQYTCKNKTKRMINYPPHRFCKKMLYEEHWQSQKLCKNSHFQGYQYMWNLDSNGLLQSIIPQWNVNVTKDQWKDWKNLFIIMRFRYQGSLSDILILNFDKQSDEFVRTERVCRKIGQRALARVLGDLWWLPLEREQNGRQFDVCFINFGQFFDILSISTANEV